MVILSTGWDSAPMKKMIAAAVLSAEMHPERVGERITAMRICLGLNKADFADTVEIDRSTLTKVEAGTKGLDIVAAARIADMFGFGLDYIYRGIMTDAPDHLRARAMTEIHAARMDKLAKKSTATAGRTSSASA